MPHRLRKERGNRRLAAALLRDVIFLPRNDQKSALAGAAHLLDGLPGIPHREAARLFSKLPEDLTEASKVLRLLTVWVEFVETGIASKADVEAVGAILTDAPPLLDPPREVHVDETVLAFKRTA